jgi:hypothetical protein
METHQMKHISLRLDRLLENHMNNTQTLEMKFTIHLIAQLNERFINLELRKNNTILRMLVPRKLTDTHRRIIVG